MLRGVSGKKFLRRRPLDWEKRSNPSQVWKRKAAPSTRYFVYFCHFKGDEFSNEVSKMVLVIPDVSRVPELVQPLNPSAKLKPRVSLAWHLTLVSVAVLLLPPSYVCLLIDNEY